MSYISFLRTRESWGKTRNPVADNNNQDDASARKIPDCKHLSVESMPETLKKPYIHGYYRCLQQSWSYYLRSVFWFHNETFNIWSHLLPGLYLLFRTLHWAGPYDVMNDASIWPVIACGLGFSANLLMSAACHVFCSRSVLDDYWFYQMDYLGNSLGGIAGGTGLYFLAGTTQFYTEFGRWPLYLVWVSASGVIIGCTVGRLGTLNKALRLVFNISFAGGCLIITQLPTLFRFIQYVHCHETNDDLLLSGHIWVPVYMIISVLFYGSRCPESCASGECDIFPQSHTIFHCLIFRAYQREFESMRQEYEGRPLPFRLVGEPSFWSVFGGSIIAVIMGILVMRFTDNTRKTLAAAQQNEEAK